MGFKGWDKFAVQQKNLQVLGGMKEANEINKKLARTQKLKSPQKEAFYRLLINLPGIEQDHKGIKEIVFSEGRKWRFDAYNPQLMIAIEYEGVMKGSKGHTGVVHYTNNCDKYNKAALLGWHMLRYTAMNYTQVTEDYTQLYERITKTRS